MAGYRSLAAGAALVLILGAGVAQAGVPAISTAPNPSTAGQAVTLNWAIGGVCTGSTAEFSDVTGGGNVPLCQGVVDGLVGATCSTNALNVAGVRSVRGSFAAGPCVAATATVPHTVNAAPTAVPTVGEWTMWGLAGLLLIGGGAIASRRFKFASGV